MPNIKFRDRLLFDIHFYNDFKAKKFGCKPSILTQLMYINDRSSQHKRRHNVMSKKIFAQILSGSPNMVRELLRCSFYDLDNEEIEKIDNEIERNIKLAIDLLDEEPHQTIIITSEEKMTEYETNHHFKDVKEVGVRAGKEAMTIINEFFEECTQK